MNLNRYARVTTLSGKNECWTDGYRKINIGIALISLYGHRNMVSAISAHLSQGGTVFIEGFDSGIGLDKSMSYARPKGVLVDEEGRPIPDMLHMIVVDRRATAQGSAWEPEFLHVAETEDEAREGWIHKFARMCRVPVMTSLAWSSVLWDRGKEDHLIYAMRGFGLGCWWISTDQDKWHEIISDLARKGALKA